MKFSPVQCLALFGSMVATASAANLAGVSPVRSLGRIAPADRGVAADVARIGGVRDYGRIGASRAVTIGLLMRVRNEAELKSLILAQGDRRSRYYHHYLTPAQYTSEFAPTQQTYERAMSVLRQRGFRITATLANRAMIRATANASTVERYFNTEIHSVFQAGHGVKYMNVRPAVMPAELHNVAVSVAGLHSVTTVQFFHRSADIAAIRASAGWKAAAATVAARRKTANASRFVAGTIPRPQATAVSPIATSTPSAPGTEATETPGDTTEQYAKFFGYSPAVYATAYDYPVQHGYGGHGFAAGSVISADYDDSDANLEYSTFGIQRKGTTSPVGYRVCADPTPTAKCDGLIGAGDAEGESTLDAMTILSLAPDSDFYEYLEPDLNDIGIEFAYEKAINDDVVSVLNSSFGGCETSDPAFEYASNYIAMEGSVLGITFSASSGDNGAFSCGVYATNGAPQTEKNIFVPAADEYFVAVGGTSFLVLSPTNTTTYYTGQNSWVFGGGGFSQYEPIPSWQTTLVGQASAAAMVSSTYRNIPDVAFCADPGTNPDGFVGGVDGVSELIFHNGKESPGGGTSLASPMYVAQQAEIDEVQNSRNGFVTPSLYAIAAASSAEYDFAFLDVVIGDNVAYPAATGYDDASGIGTPLGWEIAGAPEYGIPAPGVTAARTAYR